MAQDTSSGFKSIGFLSELVREGGSLKELGLEKVLVRERSAFFRYWGLLISENY